MSAYTPPSFGNFGKSGLFQVYDKDSLDHTVKLVNRTSNGATFEEGLVYSAKSNPRGYVKTSFGLQGFVVDAQAHTDAGKASTLTFKKKNALKALPGVNVSLATTTSEKDFAAAKFGVFETVSADYARANFAATAGLTTDADSNHSVSASAAVGFEGFSLGGDVKLVKVADSAFQAKTYNAGATYTYKNYAGALVSDSKFEKLKATFLASQLGANGALTLGVQAKVDLQAPKVGAPQREVILALENKVSKETTYKLAAVATSGVIVASVEHRLANPALSVSASGVSALPGSAFAPFAVSKFGVGLSFGN